MHVAFDAKRLFHNFTGLGNYSRTLVANLKYFYPDTRITLFTPKGQETPRTKPFYNRDLFDVHEGGGASWRTWSVYKDINEVKPDIFHGLSHQIPFSSDRIEAKTVVTVHDLIHRIRPRDFGRIDRMIYERKCRYACANASRIIAISEHTRKDIMHYYKTDEKQISVVYQSCDPQFAAPLDPATISESRRLFSLPGQYFLYVGSVIPRKNLLRIIEAMHQTPDADRIPLVVIGRGRRYMGQVVKAVQKFKLEDLVHFMGDVPFNFFPAIYYQSAALIYPSYYEGFGLPVIEALAVGIPVITSRSSSMPEAGGDQAVYIDPDSTEQLLSAMQSVLSAGHGSDEDIARRKKHVEKFAPESTTSQLMAVYDQVLNSGV